MNSFLPAETLQNSWADQQRLQISEVHFDNFTTLFNQVISCSGFPSEAVSWIKEVEIVESVHDLKSSRSNNSRKISFP